MKKIILTIAAAVMLQLALTSCSTLMDGAVNDPTKPPAQIITPTEDVGDVSNRPTEPTGPVAMGYDQYGFTLWPEGNYLADPKFDTDEYLPDFDADVSFVQYASTMGQAVAVTEDTVYTFPYVSFIRRGEPPILLFTDRATGLTMPLCGKPECTHDDYTCNAYVSEGSAMAFRVYDGKLWWVQFENSAPMLKRMGLDATDRETVMRLDDLPRSELSGNSTWLVHRGYVYAGGQNDNKVVDGKTSSSFTVYATPIDGGDSFTVLSRLAVGCENVALSMKPVGNDLFIWLSYKLTGGEGREAVYRDELYRWDSKTRKAQRLLTTEGKERLADYRTYPLPVPEDGVYFINSTIDRETDVLDCSVLKYSFETGALEEYSAFSVEHSGAARLTREHIVALSFGEEYRMRVFDREGELLCESAPLPKDFLSIALMGEDRENVYFECHDPEHDRSYILAVPLDGGDVLVIE